MKGSILMYAPWRSVRSVGLMCLRGMASRLPPLSTIRNMSTTETPQPRGERKDAEQGAQEDATLKSGAGGGGMNEAGGQEAPAAGGGGAPESAPRKSWKGRVVMGAIGTLASALYYEFFYARKLATYKETVAFVRDCPEVIATTGELELYPWYDLRGFVFAWEWRPRAWWRSIVYPPQPYHPVEHLASVSFSMKGDSGTAQVNAILRKRISGIGKWYFHKLDVQVESALLPGNVVSKSLIDRTLVTPA